MSGPSGEEETPGLAQFWADERHSQEQEMGLSDGQGRKGGELYSQWLAVLILFKGHFRAIICF